MKENKKAWALIRVSNEPWFVGYGCFEWQRPEHLGGYNIATFETKTLAKAAARKLTDKTFKFRVVRVQITVETP